MNRKQFLAAASAAAVASVLHGADAVPAGKKKPGIALQLYTLREPAKKDLAGTQKQAADMGWRYVQWSGMPNLPADKIRAALDEAGLTCIAAHVSIEAFEKDFNRETAFWKTVGAIDVAPGSMPKAFSKDLAAWQEGARHLDALGAKLRSAGMRLSFHNHTSEFEQFADDPRTKIDILMEMTKPENLCAELDIAWALAAGADPAALIRKYAGRVPVVHAKDVLIDGKKKTLTALGKGSVQWQEVFAAGKEAGIEWYIYEQDSGQGTPFDFARESFTFLSKLLQ
ncbi:MAG: sugar phosphate isomerase/epimerase [Spirochaetes bacterium]|nr:sugar phosphate isomerase/epimerase [Spirochaetota bacterium]